ncbi:hypothetical protein DL96DRAFT_1623291 [Flagelloscypha sp. PMI_526]|nr:hypothetical protein DL96DRAFT_1623291 [Flagelloscypha sp. PMI_526]
MVHLLRHSQTVPLHFRRLVYASIFFIFPTLAFCVVNYGAPSVLISPVALFLTIIYHIVLIVKHNRKDSHKSYDLVWESAGALVCGYIICVLWTAGFIATLYRIFLHNFGGDFHCGFCGCHVGYCCTGYPHWKK